MTVNYRKANEQDLETLATLRWQLWEEDGSADARTDFKAFKQTYIAWCREQVRLTALSLWVAVFNEEIVGTLYVQWVRKIPKPSKTNDRFGYVSGFFVTAEYRNRGVGTGLLEQAQTEATKADAEFLLAWPSDNSRPLWHRVGYVSNDSVTQKLRPYIN